MIFHFYLQIPTKQTQNNTNTKDVIIQKSFKYTNDLLVDSIQLPAQLITRIMNISSKQLINIKLNGKVVKSVLEPFETFYYCEI